jgi:transaldolase
MMIKHLVVAFTVGILLVGVVPPVAGFSAPFWHQSKSAGVKEVAAAPLAFDHTEERYTPKLRGDNRFFLDTADTAEWDSLLKLGIFHGVTTNPTILEKCGQPCTVENIHKLAKRALSQSNEFMCQAWGSTAQELFAIGMQLAEPDPKHIVIKVPVTAIGVEAAQLLQLENIRVCLTACYNANQALLAASVGAEYLAPYCGRMTDAGKNGEEECMSMQNIVEGMNSDTRILVASLRSVQTIRNLTEAGLDTFTFSPEVARMMFDEPLTDAAAKDFEEAAARGK